MKDGLFFSDAEFLKDRGISRVFRNPDRVQLPTDQGNRVAERQRGLLASDPGDHRLCPLGLRKLRKPQGDHGVQAHQARLGAQDRVRTSPSGRLHSEVFADLREGHLDRPTAGVDFHDLSGRQLDVRGEKVFTPMRSRAILHQHPANGDQALSAPIPIPVSVTMAI